MSVVVVAAVVAVAVVVADAIAAGDNVAAKCWAWQWPTCCSLLSEIP